MSSRKGLDLYRDLLAGYPQVMGWQGFISHLAIAPIKSLGMLTLQEARVTAKGLATPGNAFLDRSAMLGVAVSGMPWQKERFSQREEPALALVKPTWDGAETLTYSAPGMPPLILKTQDFRPKDGTTYSLRMTSKGDICRVRTADESLSTWIRTFLRHNKTGTYDPDAVQVFTRPWGWTRKVEDLHRSDTDAETVYTDGGQVLVASALTLHWMNDLMQSPEPLCMDAFRPNIVLDGLPPNLEDVVDTIDIAGISYPLKFGGLCVRCPVTQVNQTTGQKRGDKEPLKWLSKNRPARPPENDGVTFAVNAVFDVPTAEAGVLKTGSSYRVREEKS